MTTMNIQIPELMDSAVLNWSTPDGDDWIAYLARQSSPKNQAKTRALLEDIESYESRMGRPATESRAELTKLTTSLIKFCVDHGHYSVLEQACMSVTIKTTRAIAPQLLRHHSFRFQEFSQRYAVVEEFIQMPEVRFIDVAKRNPSVEGQLNSFLKEALIGHIELSQELYAELVKEFGIHPESARMFLPLCTPTTLSMTGNIRDWVFYLKNRLSPHAQKEHQDIARSILNIFSQEFPITAVAVEETINA